MNGKNDDFLFGVSQYTTWHQSFEEDVKVFAELGARAIEVCEFKLSPDNAAAQLDSIEQSGLTVTSVQAKVHTAFPDTLEKTPEAPAQRMALMRRSIETIAPHIPPATPFILNTGAAPEGNMHDGRTTLVREFRELADFAARFEMCLAIEPLNPTDINRNTFIWQITDALDLVSDIGRGNFGVCIDTWNIWQDPLATKHIEDCGDRIFAVQLSDWRLPRTYADRYKVGDGIIPFAPIMKAIRSAGYDGAYTLEIFSPDSLPDSLWKADPHSVIGDSLHAISNYWQQSLT